MLRQIAAVIADEPQENSAAARRVDRRRHRHRGRRRRARLRVHDGGQPDGLAALGGEPGSRDRAAQRRELGEGASMLPLDTAAVVASAPGIARTAEGRSAVTADVVTAVNRPRRSNGTLRALAVRGVGAENFVVRPEIVLVEGRLFTPGLREAIVGRSAQTEFEGLELGADVKLRDGVWTIVGVFTTRRRDRIRAHHGRRYARVRLRLRLRQQRHGAARVAGGFDTFKAALDANPDVSPSTSTASPTTSRKTQRISPTCSSSSPTSSARSWRPARSSAL